MYYFAHRNVILSALAATVVLLLMTPPSDAQGPRCASPVVRSCPTSSVPPSTTPRGELPGSPNPLAGVNFFVDRTSPPQYSAYLRALQRGDRYRASLLAKIALQPQFKWFGRWNENHSGGVAGAIRAFVARARREQPGSVPQVVTLRHQGKGCGKHYMAAGAAEDARTRRWFDDFARGIGTARVVIGFEPDSLGTIDCLAKSRRRARLDVLKHGVDVLSKLPNATVYLEAGASDWEPAARTARQLRYIGVHKVRGFMLNVTHYDWTANNIRHGLDISRRVGGKPFIISTSFNGRGPVHYRRWINRRKNIWRTINVWCHPLKRGLGPAPTTATHHPKADGYFYIGRPGFSGGSCNGGPMPIGSWWEDRAVMFGRYATNWIRPPRGTRNGHPGRASAKSLAGDQYTAR